MRYFGIYLAYGPTVDLHKEGLGRLLSVFLKGASERKDVRFVIACPYWLKKNLVRFLEKNDISPAAFEIVSTNGVPLALRLYLALRKGPKKRPTSLDRLARWLRGKMVRLRQRVEARAIGIRNPISGVLFTFGAFLVALLAAIPAALVISSRWTLRPLWRAAGAIKNWSLRQLDHLWTYFTDPDEEDLELRLYRLTEQAEAKRLIERIGALTHVEAWYCPTAFWPAFNKIKKPRLTCVPDVLPSDFPVGFAQAEPRMLKDLSILEQSIRDSFHIVTYSSYVKWKTLVGVYGMAPERITVVHHASWDLGPSVRVRGFPDEEGASVRYCRGLLKQALLRTGRDEYARRIAPDSLHFLFYASQFRPNKNVITLLRAYEYLLRKRYVSRKLILTGDPQRFAVVGEFIRERNLDKDVVCLHGLTAQELAACYRLADLAVNPSLSEGGCPFTLTEALSVHTPVVMSRIPMTQEIITDPDLDRMMLFDPYDWKDMAARIEWALENRHELLDSQLGLYQELKTRTWDHVVDDYIGVLETLSQSGPKV